MLLLLVLVVECFKPDDGMAAVIITILCPTRPTTAVATLQAVTVLLLLVVVVQIVIKVMNEVHVLTSVVLGGEAHGTRWHEAPIGW